MHIANLLQILSILFFMINDVELVINGMTALLGDFPYIASLQYRRNRHTCGAAIISPRFLLSSAHCFDDTHEYDWLIKIGLVNLDDGNARVFEVMRIHMPDNYTRDVVRKLTEEEKHEMMENGERIYGDTIVVKRGAHDIAVVEAGRYFGFDLQELPLPEKPLAPGDAHLPPIVEYNENKNIAIIKRVEERPKPCTICVFAGWGSTVEGRSGPASTNLKYVLLRVHNREECCREECENDPDVFCAQNPSLNAAPAFGDSGGPLICNGRLAGVISSGMPFLDDISNYVDVAYYKEWIDGIIKEKVFGTRPGN